MSPSLSKNNGGVESLVIPLLMVKIVMIVVMIIATFCEAAISLIGVMEMMRWWWWWSWSTDAIGVCCHTHRGSGGKLSATASNIFSKFPWNSNLHKLATASLPGSTLTSLVPGKKHVSMTSSELDLSVGKALREDDLSGDGEVGGDMERVLSSVAALDLSSFFRL